MKYINKLLLAAVTSSLFVSCTEEFDSGFVPEKPDEVILNEQISSYNVLNSFNTDLTLGANVSISDFLLKETTYSLMVTNFNEITANNSMTHGAIVLDNGTMDFSAVNDLIEEANNKGIGLYGKSLCWHKNQNATYLNSLVAPTVFQTPLYTRRLDKSGLEDESFDGWDITNDGAGISIVDYNGLNAVELIADGSSSNPEDLRLITPEIPVVDGHRYEVTFFIRSSAAGEGRISFEGLNENEPQIEWTGNDKSATFQTGLAWKEVKFFVDDFAGSTFKMHFDLGYVPNVTYLINVAGLSVVDVDADIENPDEIFIESENGTVGSEWLVVDDATASGDKHTLANSPANVLDPTTAGAENFINFTFNVNTAGTYTLWSRTLPTENFGGDDSYFVGVNGATPNYGWWGLGSNDWQWTNLGTHTLPKGENTMDICIRENGLKVDRFYFTLTTNTPTGKGSPVLSQTEYTLELTNEDKAKIIENTLNSWITEMLTIGKSYVKAWDVVSEPMDDDNPSDLKTGIGSELGSNEFYWQDYLGKDYAVKAFKSARNNANDGDLLFISDYGLENPDKCQGLIDYVTYIEDQGASIDGINVQLSLDLSSDTEAISTMFQKIAASGKMIRISDLQVSIYTKYPTAEELQQQTEMYNTVVTAYYEKVSAEQRYGISLSGYVDSEDNKSGLWDKNHNRKLSFTGFADGLSGN